MTRNYDYARACERATTDQGLDPVVARFTAEGLPITVDQTGGFTMVARVQPREGRGEPWIGITEEDSGDGIDAPTYLVCEYANEDDFEGTIRSTDADLDQVVAFARALVEHQQNASLSAAMMSEVIYGSMTDVALLRTASRMLIERKSYTDAEVSAVVAEIHRRGLDSEV